MNIALIPEPAEAEYPQGRLKIDDSLCIACADDEFAPEADFLAGRLRGAMGFGIPVGASGEATIAIERADCGGGEAYMLEVGECGVVLRAGTRAGIFRGIQTLLQLFPPAIYSRGARAGIEWSLPFARVSDRPRFAWRGAMLDVSRHFAPVDFIKRFLDAMAVHKLNVFHWHLTDDQGWRIEIKKYPRLTEVGSRRRETMVGHYDAGKGGDGIPHSGYYTQEEIRDIVAYAAQHHIEIVPEIDMPGHMTAAVAAYPELGCTGKPVEVATRWGILEDILHPGEEAVRFCCDVLSEVIALFPSQFVHLGGDEAVKTQWKKSPAIQKMIRDASVANEEEMQGYFMGRISAFLRQNGKRMVGWDEILEGGAPEDAVVMSWRGQAGAVMAVKSGRQTVMAPNAFTYLDHYQSADRENEPLAIGGALTLRKCYEFDPVPRELTEEDVKRSSGHGIASAIRPGPVDLTDAEKRLILGVQGQLWREYMPRSADVEYMAFPRLCALAETGWSAAPKDYPRFLGRLLHHLKRLDVMGLCYRMPAGADLV